jgi:pimeloyl-ACP methyl ester carboxylesterase
MFRNLMPLLAERYHVIAPDYPGYGNSAAPPVDEFNYTFDNLADIVDEFAHAMNLDRYSLYVMDYGAPVGYRLALKHPERCAGFHRAERQRLRGRSARLLGSFQGVLERPHGGEFPAAEKAPHVGSDEVAIHQRCVQCGEDQPRWVDD